MRQGTQYGNSTREAEELAKPDRTDQTAYQPVKSNLASACLVPYRRKIVLMMGLLTATIPQFTAAGHGCVSQPVKCEEAAHARTMVGAVMKDCKLVKGASWSQ